MMIIYCFRCTIHQKECHENCSYYSIIDHVDINSDAVDTDSIEMVSQYKSKYESMYNLKVRVNKTINVYQLRKSKIRIRNAYQNLIFLIISYDGTETK